MSEPYRTWRERLAPLIAEVIAAHAGDDPRDVRKALREAFPLGERSCWPYKVWLSEIRHQWGLTKPPAEPIAEEQPTLLLFDDP